MSVELKPCPNCGGQPKIHKTHKKFYVECDGDCWTQTGKHWYQEDAVKEWNTQIAVAKEGRQMTDHKFTDDEIIKALECCLNGNVNKSQVEVCSPCPLFHDGNCTDLLKQNALALINRQKVEIESLKIANEKMYSANKEQEAEIEALKEEVNRLSFWNHIKRTAVIDEFADRLCEGRVSNDPVVIAAKCLLKEMTKTK